jgi:hypothetical protein
MRDVARPRSDRPELTEVAPAGGHENVAIADMAMEGLNMMVPRGRMKEEKQVSDRNQQYDVQAQWPTVVPLGDTLAISTDGGVDARWVEAFEVVLDEHERGPSDRKWGRIDFEDPSDGQDELVLYVRRISPEARSFELRRTIDELLKAANTVAQVGTHVYELARELRELESATPRPSTPPPPFDPLADELDADAA